MASKRNRLTKISGGLLGISTFVYIKD